MNIYEQQAANRRDTWLIMAAFALLFAFIGLGADVFLFRFPVPGLEQLSQAGATRYEQSGLYNNRYSQPRRQGPGESFPFATVIALLVAGGFLLNSYSNGTGMVLRSASARRADAGLPSEKQLINVVSEMSIASGRPMPKVYIVPDPDPNAFATGFGESDACIAVTEGLLKTLNRNELQAVVAHEMSHIHNLDIRLMTTVAALGGALVLLSDYTSRMLFYGRGGRGSRRDSNSGGGGGQLMIILFVIWLVLIILAPILVRIMAMAISRKREYLADATAAEFTRDPVSLIAALQKIHASVTPTRSIGQGVAHMCIEDPRGASFSDGEGVLANLFCTHPPIKNRIAALKAMAMIPGEQPAPAGPDRYGL
ncbi:MAG: M48 family metallopeptidase [Elusimicrobiaceae bacterium]|nr:M48 family metallopeptidase [Elusimicrobiaceae bacterium]